MSSLSLTGDVLTLLVTVVCEIIVESWSSELNGCTSATGRPVGVDSTSSLPRPFVSVFVDSLLVFGGEPELLALLDKDNLDKGKICVEIPSFGDSLAFFGVLGRVTMSSRSSALIIVISPRKCIRISIRKVKITAGIF